jgi:hypothetical protein
MSRDREAGVEMFSKATRSRPMTDLGVGTAGADWSAHPRLRDAVQAYFLHPDIALEAIGGVLGRRRVRGFTLERVVDLTEAGTSIWQEAAVCDGRRLILWHSEESADESAPGGTVLDSSVQVLPLDAIGHIGMRTLVGHDERGHRVDRGVYLVLATAMPHEVTTIQPDPDAPPPHVTARLRPESFRFSKSLEDGGPGQIARLIDFGRLLSRLVPSG